MRHRAQRRSPMDNPLLESQPLPAFSRIRPEHVEPAITELLDRNRAELARLLARKGPFDWDTLIEPFEGREDRLSRAWSPVNHLHAVADSEALRAAYNACLPKLTDYSTELGQNEALYAAYKAIAEGPG